MSWTKLIAICLLIAAAIGTIIAHVQGQDGTFHLGTYLLQTYLQLSPHLLAIGLTVLLIDRLNEKREERRLRWQLVHELGSRNNDIADRAAYELRERGWLMDGTLENSDLHNADLSNAKLANANLAHANLKGAKLVNAELQNANLSEVDWSGATLTGANLQNADLRRSNITAEQLAQAYSYAHALLPDELRRDVG